eukprot:GGOE01001900.1.p1 GENE.GGOE01001900.1~~GGOE01001900.1.p1  ORF type:complete len:983 (-),score=271.08 GGOE01001900.1:731-3679(-)
MRLTILFVSVLGFSIVVCSLATWGITYAFSYTRLTSMAADFSSVTTKSVENFGELILLLIEDSSQVVKGILHEELTTSEERINITETLISSTSLDLVESAQNETASSQADLQELVDGFDTFMHDVMEEFEDMAVSYASQMRQEAAFKVQSAFGQLLHERILAIKRIAKLYEAGLINVDRSPDQNITAKDCSFLAMMCEASDELNYKGYIFTGLATGAIMTCNVEKAALLLTSKSNGTHLTYGAFSWTAYPSDVPVSQRKSWWERCIAEQPQYTQLTVCPLPPNCQCGYYATCPLSYQSQVNVPGPPAPRMTNPYFDLYYKVPLVTVTFPIYNSSLEPRKLLAVPGAEFYFESMKEFLDTLSGPHLMRTALVLNDTTLTTMAARGGNVTDADTNLSLVANPDWAFSALGSWLMSNRMSLVNHTQVVLSGVIWDIFPSLDTASYFVVVGMPLSEIYGPITSSSEEAYQQLQALKASHMAKLMVSENRTRSHMQATEASNLLQLEVMKSKIREQMAEFHNASEVVLGISEAVGHARLEQLLVAQRQAVLEKLEFHLSVLTSTIAWSIAVVMAVFFATLLVGVYGTLSITKGLQLIIRLMEDVAHMRVESLEVPKDSRVAEVQRIQQALDKVVGRLALYKSFMPAGLFYDNQKELPPEACPQTSERRASHRDTGVSTLLCPSRQVVPIESSQLLTPEQSMLSTTQTRITKRKVVAMVLNIVSFQDALYSPAMTECQMKDLLNQYISLVHSLVAQARGNIDSIIGDQVLVTFNAHIQCCDAPSVAAHAALELQTVLAAKLDLRLQLQIGLAEGWTYVGCGGYDAFKAMVALGSPLKVASLLAHLSTASEASVLADPAMEERLRYTFRLRPVALVCLPQLGRFIPTLARNVPIYLLEGAKDLQPNEWMYEISANPPVDDWMQVFLQLQVADSHVAASELLEDYLGKHPTDIYAQFFHSRMGLWCPKAGVQLCERPDSSLFRTCGSTDT